MKDHQPKLQVIFDRKTKIQQQNPDLQSFFSTSKLMMMMSMSIIIIIISYDATYTDRVYGHNE